MWVGQGAGKKKESVFFLIACEREPNERRRKLVREFDGDGDGDGASDGDSTLRRRRPLFFSIFQLSHSFARELSRALGSQRPHFFSLLPFARGCFSCEYFY